MRVRKLTIAAMALAAGLSLTACQNDDAAAGQSTAPPAASTAASSDGGSGSAGSDSAESSNGTGGTGGTEGTEGSGGTGGAGEEGKAAKCSTDELEITAADATVGGDTEGTVAVDLKNGGGRDCSLAGYAGVDLKTNSGTVSAERTGDPAPRVVLKDGETVTFGITYPVNDSGGSGVRITGLVVTPPDETKSVTLDWPGGASLPVTDGSGTPVRVGPLGSAGQGG
ncbi:hypothetical protein GCM10010095_65910 [Streptomyces anthocyanicus]|uniref:DUF4232 domain-containing protein n=2 Tax=Streptomyces violaceoruber group TaxID=2867121 RepID=A0ABN3TIZ2_9ACTN|nr:MULTISPECIES: DUF4232 domain-containing protein [Streptomyces]MDX3347646.1 DUF4232 domain-containing protein [Streptomyces sp. ME02-6979A]MDX3371495.1 DUF4232 domain-containing protein [Streptomyces sp. ME02-6987-2C]MDX3423989.1 DUF4232 domain-containing protein [Streptomyces sp. ME02-6985-2c]THA80977.1 DUF4232 domain-containing protein [Streptomyces sp. LRa12]GGL72027.1 hypothetical protein GCM10010095_65910 [Streptomyces anthocyanicus]